MRSPASRSRLPGPLVSPGWLEGHLDEPGVVVADVRWVPDGDAHAAYQAGHVPVAVFFDLDRDLAGTPGGTSGRHPLPDPENFAATMRAAGISEADAVVAYDDSRGSVAARLWWMLAVTGHAAGVLDGGLAAWGGPVETGPAPELAHGSFAARPWPEDAIADAARVGKLIRGGAPVLDARASERYRGEVEPIDPVAGHIPGARNAPWTENLDAATGRFAPAEELRRRYQSVGLAPGHEAAVYCGSGVTSCMDVLGAELAGLGRPRLFVGSWSGWIGDPQRPIATGSDP